MPAPGRCPPVKTAPTDFDLAVADHLAQKHYEFTLISRASEPWCLSREPGLLSVVLAGFDGAMLMTSSRFSMNSNRLPWLGGYSK